MENQFKLTPEQESRNKTQAWQGTGFMLLVFIAVGGLGTYPLLRGADGNHSNLLFFWGLLGIIYVLSSVVGLWSMNEKMVIRVEAGPDAILLTTKKSPETIPYATVKKMEIQTDLEGNAVLIYLRAQESKKAKPGERPYLLLEGFEGMDLLAREIEKKIKAPGVVSRTQKTG